jgi:uncharacterized protein (TIGR02996 family)
MAGDQDRRALWAAVIAHPDDDAPRLVFADWLEEHGTKVDVARAEFIRVQCELARLPADTKYIESEWQMVGPDEFIVFHRFSAAPLPGTRVTVQWAVSDEMQGLLVVGSAPGAERRCPGHHVLLRRDEQSLRRPRLQARESELRSSDGPAWLRQDLGLDDGWTVREHDGRFDADADEKASNGLFLGCHFERGFIAGIGISWQVWRDQCDALRSRLPLRWVSLTNRPEPGDLLECWYGRGHAEDPPGLWGAGASAAQAVLSLLAALWPGMAFELPEEDPAGTDCGYVVNAPSGPRWFRSLEEARRSVAEGGGELRAVLFPGG